MDAHASTDAVDPHAAAVRETSQEEEEEEEDAMAALLGVGREIGSSGDGADGDDRGANAPEPAAGPGAHGEPDDEDMDEDDTAEGSPERCADAPAFPRQHRPPITRGLLPPGLPTFPPDKSSFTNTRISIRIHRPPTHVSISSPSIVTTQATHGPAARQPGHGTQRRHGRERQDAHAPRRARRRRLPGRLRRSRQDPGDTVEAEET